MRAIVVGGARPNFVKIAPLLDAFRPYRDIRTLLVHTGQHYAAALSAFFFRDLQIPRPQLNLQVGSASHAAQTAEVMKRFEPVVMKFRPDVVVVVGDVNSTLACALTAAKLGIPVAHVEAGLRSFDRTMPEEINRLLTDAMAEFLFATEPSAVRNLRREGVPSRKIHLVGNIMVDALRRFLPRARRSGVLRTLGLAADDRGRPVDYAVLTLHRPSNVDDHRVFRRILGAVTRLAARCPVIFPIHPRTRRQAGATGLDRLLRAQGLRAIPPLGYLEFLHLMSQARLVLTDSGGVQEETTVLGIPCLTLRENTERPITVSQGTNRLVGTDPERIWRAGLAVFNRRRSGGRVPRLWDGKTAVRIASILHQAFS
ncbi:MAG: UDP-N-acetylglucosamine 2-epimerase (non-hydrolyzing) [Acidobacteria bacterium]|nr:UDP-N-acetylglucosamine 2-epimerase (non-hydrolyzing) [Acidobacteriota bacterium]